MKLLHKGAVERIHSEDPGFYSRIFLVPKKNGKLRLIIDLSKLNTFLDIQSFKMETANKVRQAIQPNDWAFSLDLTDAYLHVPIHRTSRKFLRFCLKGQIFQFKALPFGLATSPYVFTRLMVAVATHLRKRSIVLFPYLDDWLIRNQIRLDLLRDQQFSITLITSLGLIINEEKSELAPSQNFVFIGMEFLTLRNIVRVPADRVQNILNLLEWFKCQSQVSARAFLSLLGKLSAAAQFVVLGRLHLRPLQMALFAQWKPHLLPLEHLILISPQIKFHLNWWINRDRFIQGVPLKPALPTHSLFTDASLSGWGAHLEPEGLLFHGVWSQGQSHLHINILEMKVILLALKQCEHHVKNSSVMVATDNSSVVAYLRREGGTHSPTLCMEVWETLNWCDQKNIKILVRHIPGKTNILADRLSRLSKPISTEWSLDQTVCNMILAATGYPNIDLFATRLNKKLPVYVSPIPDDRALAIDALSMNWDGIHAYAFPPFALIPAIINKVRQHQCKIVLIAPFWPEMSWFPELLRLIVAPPLRLPVMRNLLTQFRFVNQNSESLRLHVWELSRNRSEIRTFRNRLPFAHQKPGDFPLGKCMMPSGQCSLIGVIQGRFLLSWPIPEI
ncbi:MAG: reverse transcriptase domain-containing protein [Candidatus Thiodiazotropha sp.]